jgi:GNAT superfamily N-acetyltransferase
MPGRCGHICNGGFITKPSAQGKGVGKAMGKAFLSLAPQLGYRAGLAFLPCGVCVCVCVGVTQHHNHAYPERLTLT